MWFRRFHKHTRIVTLLQCIQANELTTIPRNGGVPAAQVCSRDTASFQNVASSPELQKESRLLDAFDRGIGQLAVGLSFKQNKINFAAPTRSNLTICAHRELPAWAEDGACLAGWVPCSLLCPGPGHSGERTISKSPSTMLSDACKSYPQSPMSQAHLAGAQDGADPQCLLSFPSSTARAQWMSLNKKSPPVTEIFSETQQDN